MGRSGRLFSLLRPYTLLFVANSVATLVASVMDGATFVLLIPFLRTLFGQQAIPGSGPSSVERALAAVAGPLFAAGSPETALRNVVAVLLVTLVLKNALSYAAAVWSVAIQEGVVRDLRVQLFEHLQVLPLGFFQRTRAGQLLARVISDTDQVKTTVTAAWRRCCRTPASSSSTSRSSSACRGGSRSSHWYAHPSSCSSSDRWSGRCDGAPASRRKTAVS